MDSTHLAGHFLIAMPSMQDPHFRDTVTLLCAHNADGALGVVVNRPTKLAMADLLGQMEIKVAAPEVLQQPVFYGGPVSGEHGFVLHTLGREWNHSLKVGEDFALTTSRDILDALARGEGPRYWRLTLGYAGWSAGQLESEIAANAWLTVAATPALLFETPPEALLDAALAQLGISRHALSSQAGHA